MRFPKYFFRKLLAALIILFLTSACIGGVILWHTVPDPLPGALSWPVSPVLLDSEGHLIHARLSSNEEWCLPVPLDEMGDWLPKVLVAVEDRRFYYHPGIDFLALGRAVFQNLKAGRVVSGASTITSQLVRLSYPRARVVSTKIQEFIGALKLERSLSKEQILEYYLNRAPFGGPIRGVEAASRMYFGKRAKELSLGEASLLVGLLKGPTLYRPDRNPRAALRRRQHIISLVAEKTGFPKDLTSLALKEPLPEYNPRMPDKAWHFAELVFKTLPPEGGVARSTLDMQMQDLLEQSLQEQLDKAGEGVTASGIVVENSTGAIAAYVGNLRFNRKTGTDWVDCATAPRSPGSTLKPFVYLAAMEAGHIIPATLLADTPLQLGGEAPRNFDRFYRGPVTAHTALAESLNTPAVRVLRKVGVRNALDRLRRAGFSSLSREDADYGDSLVLGAGEVTLLELARTYAALANLGNDRPLLLRRSPERKDSGSTATAGDTFSRSVHVVSLEKYGPSLDSAAIALALEKRDPLTEEEQWDEARRLTRMAVDLPAGLAGIKEQLVAGESGSLPAPRRLYSDGASFLIAETLKDPGRLPLLIQLIEARESSPVAFKTGTSYGLRDAWTAAYNPAYTVVVWFGRADGGEDSNLLGISLAAPAALKVMRTLSRTPASGIGWYEKPASVGSVSVCALSGLAASSFCPMTRTVPNLPDVWRTVTCSMHMLRDGKTTLVWPPELEDYNRKRFAGEDLSRSVLITSPMPGARYLITPGGRWQPIPLKAEGVSYPVHWYVDGSYLGEQEREDKPLYWLPKGGEHQLSLLDARERVGSSKVAVTDLNAVMREESVQNLPLLEE